MIYSFLLLDKILNALTEDLVMTLQLFYAYFLLEIGYINET